jgi:hypothetical protein
MRNYQVGDEKATQGFTAGYVVEFQVTGKASLSKRDNRVYFLRRLIPLHLLHNVSQVVMPLDKKKADPSNVLYIQTLLSTSLSLISFRFLCNRLQVVMPLD